MADELQIYYVGGPTSVFDIGGLRFITDPTFDAGGTPYRLPGYTLVKMKSPSVSSEKLGVVDIVLLSHDHHYDNLDNSGRNLLSQVKKVYTTPDGAKRIGEKAVGLRTWESVDLALPDGQVLSITGTPCRHGPPHGDRGPVTGFVLNYKNESKGGVYVTGDTVWYEGIQQVAERFNIGLVLLFLGAAIVKEVGANKLTMGAEDAIKVAQLFADAIITPLHYEGWQHYTESKNQIEDIFRKMNFLHRLQWAAKLS